MFLANILWAVAYDTQYAMVDRDDDLKIGIKSTAILFGQNDKLIIGILQVGVLVLMALVGWLNGLGLGYYWSLLVAGALFVYQQKLIVNRERDACFKAFMNNNYVGLVLFLGLAMSYWHFDFGLACKIKTGHFDRFFILLALCGALDGQTHIRRDQFGQHLIDLHRFFRFGIPGIADESLVTQRQHQRAEHRFIEEFRRVNAVQH